MIWLYKFKRCTRLITVFTTLAVGGWSEIWRVMLSTAFNFWAKNCWSTNIKTKKNLGPKSLDKIRSVTAEILLTLSLCGWVGGGCKVIFKPNPTVALGFWQFLMAFLMGKSFNFGNNIEERTSNCCLKHFPRIMPLKGLNPSHYWIPASFFPLVLSSGIDISGTTGSLAP